MKAYAHGDFVIAMHVDRLCAQWEWDELMVLLNSANPSRFFLASLGGATIDGDMRTDFVSFAKPRSMQIAAILDSLVTRTVFRTFSWFMKDVKVFAPDSYEAVLTWLRLDDSERRWAHETLATLAKELGINWTSPSP